jgi:hypothetical protein
VISNSRVQLLLRVGQGRQRINAQEQGPRFLFILVGILRLAVVSRLHFQVCVRGTVRRPCHNTALGAGLLTPPQLKSQLFC